MSKMVVRSLITAMKEKCPRKILKENIYHHNISFFSLK